MRKPLPLLILTLFLGGCAPRPESIETSRHMIGRIVEYVGERNEKGEYHGKGTATYTTGKRYLGEFINGKPNGKGTLFLGFPFSDYAERYVGEFKDGYFHGQGTYFYGDNYQEEDSSKMTVGMWKDGEMHGLIKQVFYTVNYFGEYDMGKRRGYGVDFRGDEIESGIWAIIPSDDYGNTQLGLKESLPIEEVSNYLKNKYPHFTGFDVDTLISAISVEHTLISPYGAITGSGAQYEGKIIEGTKEKGKGDFVVQSGDFKGNRYEGEFLGEKFHGQGMVSNSHGWQYIGEFKDGKYHGYGEETYENDMGKYEGQWKNGRKQGQGVRTYRQGNIYVGEWKDDERNGQGTYTFADGDKYVGEWKDGKQHGKGVETTKEGEIRSGIWVKGVLQKKEPVSSPVVTAVKSTGVSISGFIAVLEFEGNNISSGEVRALTDRLRSELVTIGQFTIIERGKMDEVLKEQAFQQTGCVSSECAVEVGKLLGVENIITGSISRVGTIYSVSARAFSVASGEIIKTAVYDHLGDIGGLLTQGMRKVAEELGK